MEKVISWLQTFSKHIALKSKWMFWRKYVQFYLLQKRSTNIMNTWEECGYHAKAGLCGQGPNGILWLRGQDVQGEASADEAPSSSRNLLDQASCCNWCHPEQLVADYWLTDWKWVSPAASHLHPQRWRIKHWYNVMVKISVEFTWIVSLLGHL